MPADRRKIDHRRQNRASQRVVHLLGARAAAQQIIVFPQWRILPIRS
jgi:hypothetical protein